jgi:hypothetical protein
MFSCLTISSLLDQSSSTLNTLLVSAFLLLVIHPGRLFEVGFQLSYSSVLGIVILFPRIRSIYNARNPVLRWIWDATAVSLSAQVITLPMVAYYFHQVPVYSLITNLVSVPLLSLLISLFVISVPCMASDILHNLVNWAMIHLSTGMNYTMKVMASLPGATLTELYPDRVAILLMLSILGVGLVSVVSGSTKPRFLLMVLVAARLIWGSWTTLDRKRSSEFAVADYRSTTLLTFREGGSVDHFRRKYADTDTLFQNRCLHRAWNPRHFQVFTTDLQNVFRIDGSVAISIPVSPNLLGIGNDRYWGWIVSGKPDTSLLKCIKSHPGHFLLLSGNPYMSEQEQYINKIASCCIVDGSNRWYYGYGMREVALRFHWTRVEGAYWKRW